MTESIGEWVDISTLNAWKDNPRQNKSAIDEVAKSIKRFGFASPIIARAADNMIIAGHTRFEAAKKIGLKSVPVRFMDLDLNDAQLLALADNKIGEIADWDQDKLKEVLSSLEDQDLSGLGWSDEELDALIDQDDPVELNGDPDDVPEVEEQAITSAGDLWILGDHRLLCGDSTKEEDIGRLMAGEKADLWITDPPYNVAYEGKTKDKLKIKNDSITDTEFSLFLDSAYEQADQNMKEGAVFYIWHEDTNIHFRQSCLNVGWLLKQCLIWKKQTMVIGRQDYHWQHESCLYGWKAGAAHLWNSDRKQTTILEYDKPNRNGQHPTMKPVQLISYQIQNSTKKDQNILDSFGGSGSTLIACEQTNRKCFMMELDPKYCDVIIRRWQQLTGKEAIKEDGIKFNEIADIPW